MSRTRGSIMMRCRFLRKQHATREKDGATLRKERATSLDERATRRDDRATSLSERATIVKACASLLKDACGRCRCVVDEAARRSEEHVSAIDDPEFVPLARSGWSEQASGRKGECLLVADAPGLVAHVASVRSEQRGARRPRGRERVSLSPLSTTSRRSSRSLPQARAGNARSGAIDGPDGSITPPLRGALALARETADHARANRARRGGDRVGEGRSIVRAGAERVR
jgi:hypothetical protein